MLGSFFSDVLAGDPIALLIMAVVFGALAFTMPTALRRAKERAEIANYNASTAAAILETRYADRDIHPKAAPAVSLHREQTQIDLNAERERRNTGLDGAYDVKLTGHQLIEKLQARYTALVDERKAETDPDKKAVLNVRIAQLQEELRARGQQEVAQAGGRSGMGTADTDPNVSGGSQSGSEADTDPVSATNAGTSKRRPGFTS
jgi:type II secretory pathway pseudopilin PulG